MEQKSSYHAEVYSQTVSSPFQLQQSPSEFSLGEALEYLLEKSMGSEGADTQGYQDGKVGEFRAKYRNFASTDVYFDDVCARDLSFAFKNRDIMNGFSSIGELTETLVCTQNLTPKNSCISATMDSQSSICLGNPISAAKPIGRDNQARGAYSGSGEQSDEDDFEIEVGPCGDSADSLDIKRFRRYPI